ncbi:MAG TPA: carboxypeptidase-like regulatory domain-containing protein [Gemmatimonadaceae bacterium]|nr:carboxypeptidase-like regulatory domain-containing protein [Gemmatimonadaceae bacterium]
MARPIEPEPRRRAPAIPVFALVIATLIGDGRPAAAQTVFEAQGGGSTLFGGYGSLLNFWSPRFDGWAGVGWQDGWRFGAFMRTEWRRDTIRVGNDVVPVRLPTDVFGSGTNVLVQGVSLVRARNGATYRLFGGGSAIGIGAPLFSAARANRPLGALQASQPITTTLTASATVIAAERQTALAGLEWRPIPQLAASGVGGVGSNHPYGAAAALYSGRHVDWRVALVGSGRGFQRASLPLPAQTEVDGANFNFTVRPTENTYVGIGRQRFRRDSLTVESIVATASNITAGTTVFGTRLMASVFRSEILDEVSYATAVGGGRSLGRRFDVEYYYLRSDRSEESTQASLFRFRESITRRLQLSQYVSVEGGQPRGGVGGTVMFPFGTVTADYQLQHMPFDQLRPFRQSLVIMSSLQLGNYKTSVSTQLDAGGRVAYSATGSTFLYLNQMGGVQPQTVGVSLERFMVRGIVRDEEGNPVEGAAVDVEGQLAFTNRSGEFFVRVPRPREYRLQVVPAEFLSFEQYEVVSQPETAPAAKAADAVPAIVVLRRVRAAAPAPPPDSTTAPAGSPPPDPDAGHPPRSRR